MLTAGARRGLAALAWLALVTSAFGCSSAPAAALAPVPERATREVLRPRSFVWLSSEHETGFLPSAVTLGGKTSGRVILYFEFPELTNRERRLERAYLLLELGAEAAARVSSERVPIELSRAGPARVGARAWSQQPRAVLPRSSSALEARQLPLRLDVTEQLLTDLAQKQATRLMLRAEPGDGEGVTLATGAAGGRAPRLDLYWE